MTRRDDAPSDAPAAGAPRRSTFHSLSYPGTRRYFAGLTASMAGTWMQSIALSWLVVHTLGGHGRELGRVAFLQFAPTLVLSAWAGALADRLDKRRLMVVTQLLLGASALALGVLDLTDRATLGIVEVVAAITGVASAFDTPIRRSLIGDLVPSSALPNAMALNTSVLTSSRVFGMAVGGFVTRWAGTQWCFLLNGASYLFMLFALAGLGSRAHRTQPDRGATVREALRHVARTRELAIAMGVVVTVTMFAFNYQLTFPLLVTDVFHGGADALGWLLAITSVGSFAGSLLSARRSWPSLLLFLGGCAGMGVAALAVSVAPTIVVCAALSILMGLASGLLMSQLSGLLTQLSPPSMRGRVLALQSVVFSGMAPIGGPILGAVADSHGARVAVGFSGVVCLAGALTGLAVRRGRPTQLVSAASRAGGSP